MSEGKKFSGKTAVIVAIAAVAVAAGAAYYVRSQGYESTDNAFLEGNVIQVSPRVPGQVKKVYVEDNQHVNKGDLLLELDAADYEAKLAEMQAKLDTATAQAESARTGIALTSTVTSAGLAQADAGVGGAKDQVEMLRARLVQQEAAVDTSRAVLAQAEAHRTAAAAEAERAASDASRYEALYKKDEVSKQMLDRALTDARASAANREAAVKAVDAAKAQLAEALTGPRQTTAALRQSESGVRQAEGKLKEAQSAPDQVAMRRDDLSAQKARLEEAKAAVEQASLSLSYTKIYAADSGTITRKSVEPGNFLGAGQVVFALVSDHYWVVANFKETQLEKMRPGQTATVKVDAYPQLELKGKVDSIQSGTGARFSMMPTENATGNYVKVVQRVPVKIVLLTAAPAGIRLGPGMSVEPEVAVK